MKRILLVTTSYPGHTGSDVIAGGFVPDFAKALIHLGVMVDIVAPASVSSRGTEEGISVTRFAVPRLPLSLLRPTRVRDWRAITTTLREGARTVADVCADNQLDHILALWALPSGDWAMRVGRNSAIPYSTWTLGSDIWSLARIPIVRQHLIRVLKHASYRFADGIQLAEDVEQISGLPCSFLPTSRKFEPAGRRTVSASPPYRLAFLGRWHTNKGVDLLLDALALLNDEDWSRIELVRIHGGGPLEALVRERVARLRLLGRPVQAKGYLNLDGARRLFDWADQILIPSRIESIPVVFSDAMQAVRPVIATPVGDLPRLVKAFNCGVLADSADPPAIAAALRKAISLPALAFSKYVINAALSFDVKTAAAKFLDKISTQ